MFRSLYRYLARHRPALHVLTLAATATCLLAVSGVRLREDIGVMLPDDGSDVAVDFRLLQQSPFSRRFLVDLGRDDSVSADALLDAAERLASDLRPPYFARATAGVQPEAGASLVTGLLAALPSLLAEEDLGRVAQRLGPEAVARRLADEQARLLSPEGWALKGLLRIDPLGLRDLGFERIRALNLMPSLRLRNGRFISADGRHALIVADTTVAMTDSAGIRAMLEQFRAAVGRAVPAGVRVSYVSGHRYTAANAEVIRRDLAVVLTASSVGILALFLAFLRSWRAAYILLLPAAVLSLAALVVSWVYASVSAITLGFGSVLLGISDDYGLHVYYSVRCSARDPETVLDEVSLPVLFAGLTTLGAFAVLFLSNLPGQRQLAVFSLVGVGASLAVSLLVMPHLLVPDRPLAADVPASVGLWRRLGWSPRAVLALWLAVLVVFGALSLRLRFNGNLRAVGYVSAEIQADEAEIERAWGGLWKNALVFAEGRDLEAALAANEQVWGLCRRALPGTPVVSLAPILPSAPTQAANRARWTALWHGEAGRPVADVLRREGARLGYAATAFEPFLARLAADPVPVGLEDLRHAGLADWLDALVIRGDDDDGRVQVVSILPDSPAAAAAFAAARTEMPGVRFVSPGYVGKLIGQAVSADFRRLTGLATLAVVALLFVLFRDWRKVAMALVPVATGLVFTCGGLAAIGAEFTIFNVVAVVLIVGLGVDYGVFMVYKIAEGHDDVTDRAMVVSGLTTLAGFGALVLARHPAMHAIGLTALLGIGMVMLTALVVVPALYARGGRS